MSFFEWNAKYDVHVNAMNDQHKQIIAKMNDLFDANKAKAPKEVLERLIDALAAITVAHFKEEEAHMASIGFPTLEAHKAIHQQLLNDFGKHREAFTKGTGTVSEDFFNFLKLWLSAHMQHIDAKYGTFPKKTAA